MIDMGKPVEAFGVALFISAIAATAFIFTTFSTKRDYERLEHRMDEQFVAIHKRLDQLETMVSGEKKHARNRSDGKAPERDVRAGIGSRRPGLSIAAGG